jgi:nucleoside-diphosphate-sugar epimerase
VHQMTSLASMRTLNRDFALTNRLKTEGTEHLIAAARAAGARKLGVQSYTGWPSARGRNRIKTEDDPLGPDPPRGDDQESGCHPHTGKPGGKCVRHHGNCVAVRQSLRPGHVYFPARWTTSEWSGNAGSRCSETALECGSFLHVDDAAAARLAVESRVTGFRNSPGR